MVSRQTCAVVAKELGLGDRLAEYAGAVAPDELQRIARSRNVLAAVLEAAMAALYLEHGFEKIEPAIVAAFSEKIEYARSSHVDYKTELQEALARSGRQVHYTVLEVEGPPHDRRFVCAAHVAGVQLGVGRGSTKKAAEQEAARQALDALGVTPDQIYQREQSASAQEQNPLARILLAPVILRLRPEYRLQVTQISRE